MHFKEQIIHHVSKLFCEILDLGPPVNAPAQYRSPLLMYNVALKREYARFEGNIHHIT